MKKASRQPLENLAELGKKISPKEYNEFLKHLDIEDVYLEDVKTTLYSREVGQKVKLDFDEKARLVINNEERAKVEVLYTLKAKSAKKRIFNISAKYIVNFRLVEKVPDEYFEIYNHISLPIQTFPYFRELTNSIISRMGLPPLILGLRKNLVS
jgi:preprotein translocase subunit SecB